jgi:hypothetical protein
MKFTRTTTSIIVAAAVLLSAYALGLIIRHVRQDNAGQNVTSQPKLTSEPTPEERAKIKAARAQKLDESRNLTPEEKERYKAGVAARISRGTRPDVNAAGARRVMSEEERRVMQERLQARMHRSAEQVVGDANGAAAPAPSDKGSVAIPDANRPK